MLNSGSTGLLEAEESAVRVVAGAVRDVTGYLPRDDFERVVRAQIQAFEYDSASVRAGSAPKRVGL